MLANIIFYIHHHGSGHFMRCLAIAKELADCQVTFMGSHLSERAGQISREIKIIDLPIDVPGEKDIHVLHEAAEGLHYAPLNVSGQLERVKMMTDVFYQSQPCLLVVDVSVEVAMLARLCGVPAILMRQHGKRNDLPHHMAYQNAIGLLAPYHRDMQGQEEDWITDKTYFAGGLARFPQQEDTADVAQRMVGVIVGSGGSSIDTLFIRYLCESCPDWHFHLLGEIDRKGSLPDNITIHGQVNDPKAQLAVCCIIIGNAGHNTVMEMASLHKRFIVIPEERPFAEQLDKAQLLSDLKLAVTILPEDIMTTDWNSLLTTQVGNVPNWKNMVETNAAAKAADYIRRCYHRLFNN